MTDTAEIVIIGGGHRRVEHGLPPGRRNCRNIFIIESEHQQGMGSTGKSAGGVRAQFATPINIRMSLYSMDFFSRFEEVTGHDPGYQARTATCSLPPTDRHLDYLKANRSGR